MTLAPAGPSAPGLSFSGSTPVDPFGLWQAPSPASPDAADAVSFGVPGDSASRGESDTPAAVWTLALTSGPDGRPQAGPALERLTGQVHSIQAGIDAAGPRVDALLSALADPRGASGISFALEPEPHGSVEPHGSLEPKLPAPEAGLLLALSALDPEGAAEDLPVSFGLPAGPIPGLNWEELYQRLSALVDGVNRQILHFAWVETTLDGSLVARTTVNWGGDFVTLWKTGLPAEQQSAHCGSLELAMAARLANLRALLTVSQIAAKIALAVATPLGPLQAMSLAWQFVSTLISQTENH